ncbi:HAD-IB family hydrolase [Pseudoalteromonas ulvae]|uniref:HAD-IB family hydrolase n=1 Tax=Pseudoalteromonas ulvae TaxID=107327 RepID=UPI00186B6567|nr:HAD-IB family hydrolase [Pseudoalteromonas ulvae]
MTTTSHKPNLALFDFDGTITEREMFSVFLRFSAPTYRKWLGNLIVIPCYLLYQRGLFSPVKLRKLTAFLGLAGRRFSDVDKMGCRFSHDVIPQYLRENALAQIRMHQQKGDVVVVVSASLDVYLSHWCKQHDLLLLCNQVKVKHGFVTGTFKQADCSNQEKVNKVKQRLDLSDFDTIYAYGDTEEDLAMLAIADEKYMNWQKISNDD